MKVPLSRPDISQSDKNAVLNVLNTDRLCLGPKLEEFEEKFARYMGSKYAVAVNSGTSALHLCLKALNIKDGDQVITSPFSFIASANCILFENGKVVFVDIDPESLNIDVDKLAHKIKNLKKHNSKLKAILPVHVFGRPCEMDDIIALAKQYDLMIIEDACEAIGAEYLSFQKQMNSHGEWRKVGTFGNCGTFAFYPNKQMTTGEGGMLITDNKEVAKVCKSLSNQGREEKSDWLQHKRLGYNYRLSDINCALGIAQLERIDKILAKREKIYSLYKKRLKDIEELILPELEDNKKISWFVYVVRLTKKFTRKDRDLIIDKLREKGIGCSNYFAPIHLQPFYQKMFSFKHGDFPITESISERTIALPFFNNLSKKQIDYVCECLKKIIDTLK